MNNLQLSPQAVPHDVIQACPHLHDRHLPAASLTDLVWVLHGTRRSDERDNIHRIHHVTTSDNEESMEHRMREHFSLESLAVKPKRSFNYD